MKVAIVGPELSKWKDVIQIEKAKAEITDTLIINKLIDHDVVLISGHCPKGGIDIWAEEIADNLGIKKEIYPAEVNQWPDEISHSIEIGSNYTPENPSEVRLKGYKSRNIQIAEACDVLYCIAPSAKVPFIHGDPFDSRTWYCIHCKESGHPTNGGCYTLKKAKGLGKEVHLIIVT